jgi:hypothetical protein
LNLLLALGSAAALKDRVVNFLDINSIMKLANRVSARVTVPRHKVRSRVASPAVEPAVDLHPDIKKVLYSEQTLRSRVQQMGR